MHSTLVTRGILSYDTEDEKLGKRKPFASFAEKCGFDKHMAFTTFLIFV